jgi:hypothetical protein
MPPPMITTCACCGSSFVKLVPHDLVRILALVVRGNINYVTLYNAVTGVTF